MKGQSSMEFLALVSLSMLMLAVLQAVIVDKQSQTFQERAQGDARAVADKVSFNLEMALVQGEGYSRVISLPGNIAGRNYSVQVTSGAVRVDWGEDVLIRSTRYTDDLTLAVDDSNVFRIKNNETGVFVVEQ